MITNYAQIVDTGTRKGLKLLSLDAGGSRAISQLMILKHIIEQADNEPKDDVVHKERKPCEIFDLIGGVGTGGLIAILLVIFKMSTSEALEEFADISIKVFKDVHPDPRMQTRKLKRVVQDIFDRYDIDPERKLISEGDATQHCKLIVPVMYKDNIGATCVLSNFSNRREPSTNLTVAEAMLTTMATTPIFDPVKISKDFSTFEYISGDLGLSNPVREVIASAHRAFGDETTVACLLSIGCGNPGVNKPPAKSGLGSQIHFLERVGFDSERAAEELNMQMGHLALYHRLSVKIGLEVSQPYAWKDLSEIVARTRMYVEDLEVAELASRCIAALKDVNGFTTLEKLVRSGGTKTLPPSLPPLTPHYVERKIPMESLKEMIFGTDRMVKRGAKIVVVTGLGGCGKTQLVRKFVEIHRQQFTSVHFVDGSSKESLRYDIVKNARAFGIAHSQDSFEEAMEFLSRSGSDGERLLVLDNVDDPSLDLSRFLPRWTSGTIIITSRNYSRGLLSPTLHLQLDAMSPDESVELLSRGLGRTIPISEGSKLSSMAVANELGYLPIALVQAIGYMFNTGCSEDTYIVRLRNNKAQVLQNPATSQLDMRYKTAFAAFDASYSLLSPTAQKALHLLSFYHRQRFPVELIHTAANRTFSREYYRYLDRGKEFERGIKCLEEIFYSSGKYDPVELDLIIASLRNNALITLLVEEGKTLLHMHPLIHEWGRIRLPIDDTQQLQDAAVRLLCCGATCNRFSMIQHLPAHLLELSPLWGTLHVNDAACFVAILNRAGLYLDACRLSKQVYDTVSRSLAATDPKTITALTGLASAYSKLARYSEAERLQSQVLKQRKKLLGVNHLETIRASESLATTYRSLGRYSEAKTLFSKVLRRRTKLLGVDHPDTIRASMNLVATYRDFWGPRLREEWRLRGVQKQRTKPLGVGPPEITHASENLANTYAELGLHSYAEQLQSGALDQSTKLLRDEYIRRINASENLADMYAQFGSYSEAKRRRLNVLEQRKKLLGVDHPKTIYASEKLALVYRALKRYSEAERLQVDILKQRTNMLGVDHLRTTYASENLAITYQYLRRYSEAEQLQLDILKQRTRLLGGDHYSTTCASENLAQTYQQLGRSTEAERLLSEALRQRIKFLGAGHPDTVRTSGILAKTYRDLGRYSEAKQLEAVVRQYLRTLHGRSWTEILPAKCHLEVIAIELHIYLESSEPAQKALPITSETLENTLPLLEQLTSFLRPSPNSQPRKSHRFSKFLKRVLS